MPKTTVNITGVSLCQKKGIILGDVHVGNGSIIGANAVVLHDVSERCSVAGVPARILHENIDIDEKCNLRKITGK